MVSKRLGILSFITATALVSGVLVGCGGSGASTAGAQSTVPVTGGLKTAPGNTTTSAPTSTTPQQVQVTVGGTTVTGVVPPGQPAITPTTKVSVIPANTPFIQNTTFAPSVSRAPSAHPLNTSTDGGNTWVWSGCNINADMSLDKPLILPAGTYICLQAVGKFSVSGTVFPFAHLTVGQFIFGVYTDDNADSSFPNDWTGKLPANNTTTANGHYVNATYDTPDFATGTATLILSWPGVTKTQKKTLVNGLVGWSDPIVDTKDPIPGSGVTTVQVIYQQ